MNSVHISAMTEEEAAALPDDGNYYNIPGVRVNVDNQDCWLESREEVDEVIADLIKAADRLWPLHTSPNPAQDIKVGDEVQVNGTGLKMIVVSIAGEYAHLDWGQGNSVLRGTKLANLIRVDHN